MTNLEVAEAVAQVAKRARVRMIVNRKLVKDDGPAFDLVKSTSAQVKVGKQSGWTTGEITGTCVNLSVSARHPDGVYRYTDLPCYIETDNPVRVGDSGTALFSILYDPNPEEGGFLGILSACSGCSDTYSGSAAYYVSWSAIDQALSQYVTLYEDKGGD